MSLQSISSFDVVSINGRVHVLVAGKSNNSNNPPSLHYLFSDDLGGHWSLPVEVASDANLTASRGNDVQIAAVNNNLVALWQTQGELPNMGPIASRFSHDGGKTWHPSPNPAIDNNGDQSHIDLIADNKGYFHAVWLADPEENGYQSLRYARSVDGGEHWQASLTLDDSTCSCCWNTLALSSTNVLSVLYRDMVPRDMALIQSFDQGSTWQRAGVVGDFKWQFDGCPHNGGGLAIAGDGAYYASVWTGQAGLAGLYTLSSANQGKIWDEPKVRGGKTANHSDIAAISQRVVMVWDEREPDGMAVFFAISNNGGQTWSTPVHLSTTGKFATHPRVVSTPQGFLSMWTEKQGNQAALWVVKKLD
ncbi:MAG: sialidase family protein [Methylococcales bacterium]|nr:sialidase family protein [Methylococcales bacterium]